VLVKIAALVAEVVQVRLAGMVLLVMVDLGVQALLQILLAPIFSMLAAAAAVEMEQAMGILVV
jgi:hypothetical protein